RTAPGSANGRMCEGQINPQFACEHPPANFPRSRIVTFHPISARKCADDTPTIPLPMTIADPFMAESQIETDRPDRSRYSSPHSQTPSLSCAEKCAHLQFSHTPQTQSRYCSPSPNSAQVSTSY